ncbi:hypothetical protein Hamer_G009586, partial [Homarus americanus]
DTVGPCSSMRGLRQCQLPQLMAKLLHRKALDAVSSLASDPPQAVVVEEVLVGQWLAGEVPGKRWRRQRCGMCGITVCRANYPAATPAICMEDHMPLCSIVSSRLARPRSWCSSGPTCLHWFLAHVLWFLAHVLWFLARVLWFLARVLWFLARVLAPGPCGKPAGGRTCRSTRCVPVPGVSQYPVCPNTCCVPVPGVSQYPVCPNTCCVPVPGVSQCPGVSQYPVCPTCCVPVPGVSQCPVCPSGVSHPGVSQYPVCPNTCCVPVPDAEATGGQLMFRLPAKHVEACLSVFRESAEAETEPWVNMRFRAEAVALTSTTSPLAGRAAAAARAAALRPAVVVVGRPNTTPTPPGLTGQRQRRHSCRDSVLLLPFITTSRRPSGMSLLLTITLLGLDVSSVTPLTFIAVATTVLVPCWPARPSSAHKGSSGNAPVPEVPGRKVSSHYLETVIEIL